MKFKYIILIFVLLIISNIFIIILNNTNKDYVLFGTNTMIEYKNGKFKKIMEDSKINKKLNYEIFNVYNNNKIDKYYLNIKEGDTIPTIEIYGLDNEKINLSNDFLAYSEGIYIDVTNTNIISEITNEDKIIFKMIFDKYNLDENYNMYMTKIQTDIDNDNKTEKVYSINNYAFSIGKIYSLTFLVDNENEIIIINEIIDKAENIYEVYKRNLSWIVDIDNDNQYEIVLSRKLGDDTPTYYEFYKYNNNTKQITQIK